MELENSQVYDDRTIWVFDTQYNLFFKYPQRGNGKFYAIKYFKVIDLFLLSKSFYII